MKTSKNSKRNMNNIHLHPGRQPGRNSLRGGRRAELNGLRLGGNALFLLIGIRSFFHIAS